MRGKGLYMTEPKIVNIVVSADIHANLDLNYITREIKNTEFEPEQFPGLVYKLPDAKATFLLFSNGKIVCTGTKSEEEVHKVVEKLVENLKKVR